MDVLRYLSPANFFASLHLRHHRKITYRHLLLVLVVSAFLTASYYVYLRPSVIIYDDPRVWPERAARVKRAFLHAYHGYELHAFPHDELLPVSNGSVDNFNGWGVTAIDALDTMLLMGLEDEYTRALPALSHANFSLPSNTFVPFFETVIRYLGGLLAAYAISGHDLLRDKADQLGSILAPAFNTTSGFPNYSVDTFHGNSTPSHTGVLAEIASCQMEYAYLGKITGKKEHVDHATLITDLFYNANLSGTGGMYPTLWNLDAGAPSNRNPQFTVGALADSGHEYTLKQFLLTARTDKRNLEMYLRLTSYVINNLLYLSPRRNLLYVTDITVFKSWTSPSHSFEHLSCFFPGLLALGAHLLPLNHLDTLGIDFVTLTQDLYPEHRKAYADLDQLGLADVHLWAAQGLAQTCYLMYADQPTGLGPEIVRMDTDPDSGPMPWIDAVHQWKAGIGGWDDEHEDGWWTRSRPRVPPGVRPIEPWTSPLSDNVTVEALLPPGRNKSKLPQTFGRDYLIRNAGYFLRPETIESLYILWRTTGDVAWRQRGWHIFEAIERYTKTEAGYATVDNVHTTHPTQNDVMPSYFLAETLKYLYLLFSNDDLVPLERWVFNTEGHPLPVFEWLREERTAYGIP